MTHSQSKGAGSGALDPRTPSPTTPPATLNKNEWRGIVALRTLLIVAILGELLYLSRHTFVRKDLTDEKLYTLTDSSRRILGALKDRLMIEAYFTRESNLPGVFREERQKIVDFLDEYRQLGKGKVEIDYLDPEDDALVRERADRLGIQKVEQMVVDRDAFQTKVVYQGLRLLYGADKQKVIPTINDASGLETELTPKIKELTLEKKPKIGIYANTAAANPMMQRMNPMERPAGYEQIQASLGTRYEVQRVDLSDGKLLPDDLDALFMILPKDLTDRQKYALDQFLMLGKKVAIFVDVADYSADHTMMMFKNDLKLDAGDAKLKFVDQLAAYGAKVENKLVIEGASQFNDRYLLRNAQGMPLNILPFPYFPVARAQNWAAKDILKQLAPNDVQAQERMAKEFGHGIDPDAGFLEGITQVAFYWACPVGTTDKLPDGVTGRVVIRTSPFGLTEDPPYSTNPKQGGDLNAFYLGINSRVLSETRKQVPMAAYLEGTFTSFFQGKDIPAKKVDAPAAPHGMPPGMPGMGGMQGFPIDKGGNVLQDPSPPAGSRPAEAGAPLAQDPPAATQGETRPATEPGDASQTQPSATQPGALEPPVPVPDEKDKDPEPVYKAKGPSRLLVVGDATFIRDDALQGLSHLLAAPSRGATLFQNLVDTFSLDDDLIALRTRRKVDRKMSFGERDLTGREAPEEYEGRMAAKKAMLRWLNIGLTPLLLIGFGLLLMISRSSAKRTFLKSQSQQRA